LITDSTDLTDTTDLTFFISGILYLSGEPVQGWDGLIASVQENLEKEMFP